MVKNRHLKRIIEDAIDRCGGVKMQGAKSHLMRALKEISEIEKREEKKASAPSQQWKFDVSTGRLMNMTREQMNNALGNIEKMIEDESNKNSSSNQENGMTING